MAIFTRGFFGRKRDPALDERLPPGQSLTEGFPVLSAGPTPRIRTEDWSFTLKDGPRPVIKWTWDEFNALPPGTVIRTDPAAGTPANADTPITIVVSKGEEPTTTTVAPTTPATPAAPTTTTRATTTTTTRATTTVTPTTL